VELSVDGRPVGDLADQLNNSGQYVELGATHLAAGRHRLELRYSAGGLDPGSGGRAFGMGPLVLAREPIRRRITHTAPARAGRLCRRSLDWVEALPKP